MFPISTGSIFFPVIKIKIVIKRWAYGLKARSLCPSEPKMLGEGMWV
ncbi:MAG: hypothetical protein ACETWK_06475 [Candidatus Aminicenantaceae bacterium]